MFLCKNILHRKKTINDCRLYRIILEYTIRGCAEKRFCSPATSLSKQKENTVLVTFWEVDHIENFIFIYTPID